MGDSPGLRTPDEMADGTLLPATMHGWPDEDRGPWLVVLRWKMLDGRAECVGIEISSTDVGTETGRPPTLERSEGKPVTGTLLRDLKVPELIAGDRIGMAGMLPLDQGQHYVPAGMRRSTAERHQRVARVYREAVARGDRPVKAVAADLGIAESSASTIVARARAAGFLGPTSPGVPMG